MKTKYILFALMFLTFTQSSNAQATEEQIIGTWVFNYESSFSTMDAEVKTQYNVMPEQERAKIESVYRQRKITLDSNKNFTQTLANGIKSVGIWSLADKDYLNITTPTGIVFIYKIKILTSTTLNLILDSNSGAKALISELHFTKLQN